MTRCSFCVGTVLIIVFVVLWTTPIRVYESIVNPWVERYELLSDLHLPRHTPIKAPSPPMLGRMAPYSPHSTNIRSYIQGTSLRGREVRRFLSHQECFSETGQWALDETPRAMCCKVKHYLTANCRMCSELQRTAANFLMCNYDLPYCNVSSSIVYGSPLPDGLAAQIRPWTSREELKWFWQTSPSCPMLAFDREAFCKRIGRGRHMMISGDSISHQVFITFLNFLRSEISETQYPFDEVGFEPICGDVLGGEGFTLAWMGTPMLNTTWVTYYIEEWQIEILLINRGAWFVSDRSFVTELQELVKVLQARYPHLLVVYRNTPPGHKGCVDLHGPLKEAQGKVDLPFHWGEFVRQNEMAKRIVRRAHFVFLDVDTMLSLRPDGHLGPRPGVVSDCLHYSIPGPLDVVFHLFYNTLLLL